MLADVLPLKKKKKWVQLHDAKGRPVQGFYVYQPTGVLYYRKTFRSLGIPDFFQPTGETTIGRARVEAEIRVQKWKNKHLGVDDSQVFGRGKTDQAKTVRAAAQWVLEHVTPTRRALTQDKHRTYIPKVVEEFGSEPLDAMTVERFNIWIEKLRKKKFGPKIEKGKRGYRPARLRQSFEDFSKAMNLIWNTAYQRKLVKHRIEFPNPDKALIAGRKDRARRYSDNEMVNLWAQMSEDMRDQFVLAAECYMRLREALRLTWDRIDLATGKVTLRADDVKTGSKTGRGREFILSPLALERMHARFRRSSISDRYVFPSRLDRSKPRASNRTAWRLAKERAGIEGTWHHLRHTAISKALLVNQANPIKLSEYAGVSMQTIQRTYLHAKAEDTAEAGHASKLPTECKPGVNQRKAKR